MNVIGVSHIIYSGFNDIGSVESEFDRLYSESVSCPKEKQIFLRQTSQNHEITFWKNSRGLSVERVVHNQNQSNVEGPYHVNFSDGAGKITLRSDDRERTVEFWKKELGFESLSSNSSECTLLKTRPMFSKTETQLLVTASTQKKEKYFLDDRGWTGVAFLVTNVERCHKNLEKLGISEITPPYFLSVGGRKFKNIFFRGTAGELIELSEIIEG